MNPSPEGEWFVAPRLGFEPRTNGLQVWLLDYVINRLVPVAGRFEPVRRALLL